MIPRIIHQTWKGETLPEKAAPFAGSWSRLNPGWERILWTDRMLTAFVASEFPHYFDVFCSYPHGVCRADAARYMLMHKFGGLYADIDVECLAELSSLVDETRVVMCHEPPVHWPLHAPYRGHPFVLFNGVLASPPGHPFWAHVLSLLPRTRHATDILDIAGPCMLTGAYLSFADKDGIVLHGCHLFTPTDSDQRACPPYLDATPAPLTRHHWHTSWWQHESGKGQFKRSMRYRYRRWRHGRTRGPVLDPAAAQRAVDPAVLSRPVPTGERVAILVPVRDAESEIDGFVEAAAALDLPREKLKLVFCEGDSADGSRARLEAAAAKARDRFRDVLVLKKDVHTHIPRETRWARNLQRARRGGLAVVRNHLIDHGLDETDDWALWIDVDVWKFAPDIFQTLRAANARIVAPNCVIHPGGPTHDLNSFISTWDYPKDFYYQHVRDGLFQPPARARGRLHLDCVRHSERVELDGVGGTMLLVDASLHRGGLRFPEIPYKDLIETEGFGVLARDVGVRAVGLPQVEVLHVPY